MDKKSEKENSLVNAVIEIDEVEYLIDEVAASKIARGEETISLTRLIDKEIRTIPLKSILEIIQRGGVIDRVDE